jgi:hypothetical protein
MKSLMRNPKFLYYLRVSSSEVFRRHLCSYKADGISWSEHEPLDSELLFIHHTRSIKPSLLPDYFKNNIQGSYMQFHLYLHFTP